jgi:uncharacterized membrane protein YccC
VEGTALADASGNGLKSAWLPFRLQLPLIIFSLNSFIAAMLALLIGFGAGLQRPYWAMLTVYIVAQPLTGALRSKALFRVLGTVLGGVAAVLLVPPFVNSPELLSLAMAAWVGMCLYLSLLDRTPRAYVFMLAGYTAAIIGFPSVDAPLEVFDTAVSRVEEIVVGILCATLVHTIFFPREVTAALDARVHTFLRDGRAWMAESLAGQHGPRERQQRRRLASDVTELQILATHLPFDTAALRPRTRAVRALQDRLATLLPFISGVDDRLTALRELGGLSPPLQEAVDEATAFVRRHATTREEAEALKAHIIATIPPVEPFDDALWPRMLTISATIRLCEMIEIWQESLELAAFLHQPKIGVPPHLDPLIRERARRPLHRDHGLSALSAFALIAAVLGCCVFWVASGWSYGATAAMMAAVFSSFYATQDDPGPALVSFMRWIIVSLPIAAVYMFLILPRISDFPMLMLVLSPFYLFVGYMQGDPNQAARALALILGVTGALALQETFSADFESFINGNLALIIGIGSALVATRLFRTIGATWSARRILRQGWRDLADLASGRRPADRAAWTSLMLDRLGLITPRLALARRGEGLSASDALVDLRVGLTVIVLRQLEARHPLPRLRQALEMLSRAYRDRQGGEFGAELLRAIDEMIAVCLSGTPADHSPQVVAALAGLRRTLFPGATPFVMEQT